MDAAEILDRAAQVIDERGHCRNGLAEDVHGRVCAMKAIAIAAEYEGLLTTTTIDLLRETAATQYVGKWNDAHTTAEVTSTMRALAAVLRAQANPEQEATLETANA